MRGRNASFVFKCSACTFVPHQNHREAVPYKNSGNSLSQHSGRFVCIGSEILFDGANCSRVGPAEYCEAFYQKFNTNANFLRYSLPSFLPSTLFSHNEGRGSIILRETRSYRRRCAHDKSARAHCASRHAYISFGKSPAVSSSTTRSRTKHPRTCIARPNVKIKIICK